MNAKEAIERLKKLSCFVSVECATGERYYSSTKEALLHIPSGTILALKVYEVWEKRFLGLDSRKESAEVLKLMAPDDLQAGNGYFLRGESLRKYVETLETSEGK